MSNPRTLNRGELPNFAKAAAKAIADGKITGFTPEQNLALSTALENEAELLAEANKNAASSVAKAHSDVTVAQDRRLSVLELLASYKYALRGMKASDSQFEALGFDPPANPRNVTMPEAPTRLSATGFANGINKLKFKGNNGPNKVNYVVEANKGDGWFIIGTTRSQSFKHTGVIPGQGHRYRVRAQASRRPRLGLVKYGGGL